jgi:hypothetical protein
MTPKPATVHQAKPEDEDFLFALICTSGNEWSMGRQNPAKVRNVIHLATHGGPPPRPVFGVVRGPAMIEGAVGLYPTEPWDSTEPYIRCFFHFVHPDFRKSHHAVHLRDFAKWFGDVASMSVIFELLHPERTEAKARMYSRGATPIGGLFLHSVARVAEAAA